MPLKRRILGRYTQTHTHPLTDTDKAQSLTFDPLQHGHLCRSRKVPHLYFQDSYRGNPIFVRPDVQPRGSAVHHHHYYGTTPAARQLPPISHPTWPPEASSVLTGQAGGQLPSVHNEAAPCTLPPLHA